MDKKIKKKINNKYNSNYIYYVWIALVVRFKVSFFNYLITIILQKL